jgi:hypothetical protein
MSCPDIDQALSHALNEETLPPVEAHVWSCPECRSRLRLIREMREACDPKSVRVPQSLIDRAVDTVLSEVRQRTPPAL